MNSILEAIKLYPQEFIDTLEARANTTPNETNRINHLALQHAIAVKDWQHVGEVILDPWYHKPLEGVVFCLNMDYDFSEKNKIINLFKEEKFV